MKKTISAILFAGVFFGTLAAQQITVTSPAAGVTWEALKSNTITWTKTGTMADQVLIRLRNAGGLVRDIVLDTANDGSFNCYLPDTLAPGQYYIRVRTLGDASVTGDSGVFNLIAPQPPSFAMVTPQGGENWESGGFHYILWTASNYSGACRLVLTKDGADVGFIDEHLASTSGKAGWLVGELLSATAAPGSGYKIRVETDNGQYGDESNSAFTITPVPFIGNPLPKPDHIKLQLLRPDLVVCAEWSSKWPQLGDKRTVTVKVKNKGTAPSQATNFDFYVEGHGTATLPLPALAVNAEYSYAHKFWWQSWGHKTVRITIDPANQVAESNENNNKVSGSIEVKLIRDAYGAPISRCSDQN